MPVWEAQYVIVIASQTGWSEDHIRHHLPLSRGWAYYHAARLLEGEKCRWPTATTPVSNYLTKLRSWVTSLRK
jgi:hypothetical protein